MSELIEKAATAKQASFKLATLPSDLKNKALEAIAAALEANKDSIFEANSADLQAAEEARLEKPVIKRLKFQDEKLRDSVEGIKSLITLEDPVGKVKLHTTLDDGFELYRVTCPIGVIGVIFESRPDALVQIASLCLKSGNAVFLKGGSEAANSNKILADIIYKAGVESGLPEGWLNLMTTRGEISEMLKLDEYLDLIIPRGSNAFVQYIMQNTSIAVLGHADGVCHTYIHKDADPAKALKVAVDAKTQYVSVCNATETFLVDRELEDTLLVQLVDTLRNAGVELYGDEFMQEKFGALPVEEWHHEYLDMKCSVKVLMKPWSTLTDTARVIPMRSLPKIRKPQRSSCSQLIREAFSSTAQQDLQTASDTASALRSVYLHQRYMPGDLSALKDLYPISIRSTARATS